MRWIEEFELKHAEFARCKRSFDYMSRTWEDLAKKAMRPKSQLAVTVPKGTPALVVLSSRRRVFCIQTGQASGMLAKVRQKVGSSEWIASLLDEINVSLA